MLNNASPVQNGIMMQSLMNEMHQIITVHATSCRRRCDIAAAAASVVGLSGKTSNAVRYLKTFVTACSVNEGLYFLARFL
jgi:hypothetical protein